MCMIPMELHFLSVCFIHINFNLTPTIQVDEMYEELKEMDPKNGNI